MIKVEGRLKKCILTKSLKIDKPRFVLIFPLIHAINKERIALAKSENNKLQHY